jgi:hypothetical protein
MKARLALFLFSALSAPWAATEYDSFIVPNSSTSYPTISSVLSIEEGAVNKMLKREFAKSIHFHLGDQYLSRTVRVGDVLEGSFTASVTGFNDFSFGIREIGIDLQKAPGASSANMVARLAFDLNIGGVFVRSYTFDWNFTGYYKPVLLLDKNVTLDLVSDLDALAGNITYDDVCNALQSHTSTDCNEALGIVRDKLKQGLRYLPIAPNVREALADLSSYRNRITTFFANQAYCHDFASLSIPCPAPVAQAESEAKSYFMTIANSFESDGYRSDLPEIPSWEQALQTSIDWVHACSRDNSNPLKDACSSIELASLFSGKMAIPNQTYNDMVAFLGTISGLLAPNGKRIEGLPASISNGSVYVMFDKDRFLLFVNYDFKAEAATLTPSYNASTGILTLTSNTPFSIVAITPVDGWYASNLLLDPNVATLSGLSLDGPRGVYTMSLDLRYALLWSFQYRWMKNAYCAPGAGCPSPDYQNMTGISLNMKVRTSVAGAEANFYTYSVKL